MRKSYYETFVPQLSWGTRVLILTLLLLCLTAFQPASVDPLKQETGCVISGLDEEMLNIYATALLLAYEDDEPDKVAGNLSSMGTVHYSHGCYAEALDFYQQALGVAQDNKDYEQEVTILELMGWTQADLKDYDEALKLYQQALSVAETLANIRLQTQILNSMGRLYERQGLDDETRNIYDQIVVLTGEIDDYYEKMNMLITVLTAYHTLGDYDEALKIDEELLALARANNDRQQEASFLSDMSSVYRAQGRYGEALELQYQALAIYQEEDLPGFEVSSLELIAAIYKKQGQFEKALDFYQQARGYYRTQSNLEHSLALVWMNVGEIYTAQGYPQEALSSYEKALLILQSSDLGAHQGSLSVEGLIVLNTAKTLNTLNRDDDALRFYQRALTIFQELDYKDFENEILIGIGQIYSHQGRYDEALTLYQQAQTFYAQTYSSALAKGDLLYNMGQLYEAQGQLEEALTAYQQAMDSIDTVRTLAGSEQGRTGFVAQYAPLYDDALNLLYQQGQLETAFFTAERSRSRAFLDALATGQVQLSDNATRDLLTQEQAAYQRLQSFQNRLTQALGADVLDKTLIANLEAQLKEAEKIHLAALTALENHNTHLSTLIPGRGLQNVLSVTEVQTLLDDHTTLLTYYSLEDKTLAFLMTANSFEVVELDISQQQLTKQVSQFRDLINFRDSESPRAMAQDLYKNLINPLVPALNRPRVMIVPHGALHYLPFAALYNEETMHYLVEDYELLLLPSASALPFIQAKRHNPLTNPLILGNPITSNPDLPLLAFAEEEARSMAAIYQTKALLGQDASESIVYERAPEAGILHLAAHGIYNPTAPLNSLIALAPADSQDGLLTVGEVYGLDLSRTGMVVLSACQTQLGQLSAGDDVLGLVRAFFFAGTPTLVASLWSMDDAATGFFMARFYTHLTTGQNKSAALRQAQLDLLQHKDYAAPFYWANFVMSGDGGAITIPETEVIRPTQPDDIPHQSQNENLGWLLLLGGGAVLLGLGFMVIRFRYGRVS